MEDELNVSSRG